MGGGAAKVAGSGVDLAFAIEAVSIPHSVVLDKLEGGKIRGGKEAVRSSSGEGVEFSEAGGYGARGLGCACAHGCKPLGGSRAEVLHGAGKRGDGRFSVSMQGEITPEEGSVFIGRL